MWNISIHIFLVYSCEVEVKRAWYLPWTTVYDGCLPWRGSFAEAKKIKAEILEEYD